MTSHLTDALEALERSADRLETLIAKVEHNSRDNARLRTEVRAVMSELDHLIAASASVEGQG